MFEWVEQDLRHIRDGEPKRPESLIEMPSMVPEVPEVSLCFTGTQEKNQSDPYLRSNVEYRTTAVPSDHRHQRPPQNEMLLRNKNESYNTWKAKNAQTLHDITGGLDRPNDSKSSVTKKSAGLVRKQNSGNGMYSPSTTSAKGYSDQASNNGSSTEYRPGVNDHLRMTALKQFGNERSAEHHLADYTSHTLPFHQHQAQQSIDNVRNPSSPSSILRNQHSCKDRIVGNIPYPYQTRENCNPGFCAPNYCNPLQCSCVKCNGPQVNPMNHCASDQVQETRTNMQFVDPTKVFPLDPGLINNHLSSLFHLINIQNEQISMLCQEMSSQKSATSALHDDVKKIFTTVSTNKQSNCEKSPTREKSCRCCNCEDQVVTNKMSDEKESGQLKCNVQSNNEQPPATSDKIEKRSVGVMTSSIDNVNKDVSCERNKPQGVKEKFPKEKAPKGKENVQKASKQQKPRVVNSSSNKQTNQKEEKRKSHESVKKRNSKKDESNDSCQSEDSFSLDEAAIGMRTETEPGDVSPDVSIHVNMPDYSASSAESETSDSFDSEEEGQISDGESSDPQIGWTFYDRVVGQVNNMLKKSSGDPRQEYTRSQRKNEGNVLYQCNGDYETENNWSKRVTFDGPPLEDSDNNGLHMPRYHQFRTNQDYRVPVAGGQDLLVCDYANGGNNLSLVNGSTNLSFATYRYYQRHQLLPPPPTTDPMFFKQPMKKKKESKKKEKTPPSQKSQKMRNGRPPSKILDVSALKHQPKLF
ncbi:uncharacterized protein LOC128995368 [Macrosteles quadrilineatus]|uniref:uncharacterized protein LOC128995089 n=1 Tax=Macrosteles quadrilineatus TaxID=74068 RepID=UPI0023E194E4|nr:uncharacterized protein LOC128995089 [Macrosteles quadrilineatus]XP_054276350.1 uncharacterized protein LOC128995368 [Macrosteles quadrilineatus]